MAQWVNQGQNRFLPSQLRDSSQQPSGYWPKALTTRWPATPYALAALCVCSVHLWTIVCVLRNRSPNPVISYQSYNNLIISWDSTYILCDTYMWFHHNLHGGQPCQRQSCAGPAGPGSHSSPAAEHTAWPPAHCPTHHVLASTQARVNTGGLGTTSKRLGLDKVNRVTSLTLFQFSG